MELNIDKVNKKVSFMTKAPSEEVAHLLNEYIADFLRVN